MAKAIQWSDLEFVKVLGEGQAGQVWLTNLKRPYKEFGVGTPIAVKRYKNWVLEEPGQYERIIRELELGRRIQHPNLVRSLSIIKDPDGLPALIMAYYSGETLETYLDTSRRKQEHVNLDYAFRIVGELASAISAIHQAGAIHRDIKPANIILSNGSPILMDLGVISSKDFPEQTTSGSFLGTIRYAAPEYIFEGSCGLSVDVYALGAIAFELFGKERFFAKESQWARLIVAKSSTNEVRLDYPALQSRAGMNVTEFVKFILEQTLAKADQRTIDPSDISEVIKRRVWEKPFYISNGVLMEGEPKTLPLGESNEELRADLSLVVEELKKKLDKDVITELRQALAETYHTSKIFPWRYGRSWLRRLEEAGCFVSEGPIDMSGDPDWYELHEAIIAAYRYGYL